ncbi:MAG: acyl-CoA dehydrogenase [Solirubrobacterales bacterium]|nr:acyl-CoA dehydrogenase [Solirubrobacterales bacterium]
MNTPTPAMELLLSRRDVQFLLYDWLDVGALVTRDRYAGQSREVYDDVLVLAERLATDRFAPHNRTSDIDEPHVVDGRVVVADGVAEALKAYAAADLIGLALDEAAGGMQLPLTLANAVAAWFHAANTATTSYAMLTTAAANMLAVNGSDEQIARWVRPMIEGRYFGTMCISEPQAGSSLADITTRAEPQEDGSYRIFGTKMWISGGDHELGENIVHMCLAKVPGDGSGIKGISLFIAPRHLVDDAGAVTERNDVVLAGLNHKMGYRGTVNTVLGFGEGAHRPGGEAGAVGYIVGERGRGLSAMFRMMNEARIGVGTIATALGYTGYRKAVRYAMERPQGRPRGADPSVPQIPIVEHTDVKRMLLAQKAYVEGALALVLYAGRLHDDIVSHRDGEARRRASLLLEFLTPIVKSWPSQWCLEANSLAIQVHGGYGYSREYDVEQHYRDNRLNAIHEGTHGIHALDLLGRKVTMHDGAALDALAEEFSGTVGRAAEAGGEEGELGAQLAWMAARWQEVTGILHGVSDPARTLANASTYLEATGHLVVAWIWLEQLLALGDLDDDFARGKRQAARYFYRYELPKCGPQLDLLASLDTTTADLQPQWL